MSVPWASPSGRMRSWKARSRPVPATAFQGGSALRLFWCFVAAALALALRLTGGLAPVERLFHDRMMRSLPVLPASRVATVLVDEASLAAVGRWPWSRAQLARLVMHALVLPLGDRDGASVFRCAAVGGVLKIANHG